MHDLDSSLNIVDGRDKTTQENIISDKIVKFFERLVVYSRLFEVDSKWLELHVKLHS